MDGAAENWSMRRTVFTVVVVGFAYLCVFESQLPFVLLGWFIEERPDEVSHAVHQISFGTIFAVALIGLLSQLTQPERRIGPLYQVVFSVGLLFAFLLALYRDLDPFAALFLAALVLTVAIHPAGRRLLRPPLAPDRLLLGGAALIAVPFGVFAVTHIRLEVEAVRLAGAVDPDLTALQQAAVEHPEHWAAMAAFAVASTLLAFIASLRLPGWRIVGWSAAFAVGIYGAASLVFPGDASAASTPWAVLALLWAIAFGVATQRSPDPVRAEAPAHPASS